MSRKSVSMGMAMAVLSLCAQAADRRPGLSFSHHDWELACDNTRTCRAAGYQNDEDEQAVSVLLTRKAGPDQSVIGELLVGNYVNELPAVLKLAMRVNGRDLGQVVIQGEEATGKLSAQQVVALLAALRRNSSIEWTAGDDRWRLSDKGAAAVLLKMDEFQGRVGTEGALVKKGPLGEGTVLPPSPAPVVIAAPLAKPRPGDEQLGTKKSRALREALRASIKDEDCPDLLDRKTSEGELSITRLTDTKLLVSTQCWSAAYNVGHGYWVINDTPAYRPVLVTPSGSEFGDGRITAAHKGRGLGDCGSSETWTWDGKQFIHTESSSTGMCKLLAPGGAWSLPTFTTDVRHSSR